MTSLVERFRYSFSVRIVLAFLAAIYAHSAAADAAIAPKKDIGAVVLHDYQGAVARPDGSVQPHAIRYRDRVFALDTVVTGASGATSLEFLDQTRVDVGPGAEIRLDDFVYDPNSMIGAGEMSFAVGAFRYVGGRMTTEENIRLKTPTATMVIRGTELVIFVWSDGTTEINVVSGAVEVSTCNAGGGSQLLMSGMRATVTATCAAKRAAVRSLPERGAVLSLPERDRETNDDSNDGGGRRGGDGGRQGGKSSGSGSSGGGSSGGGNNGGGGGSTRS